jgi:hypothetical protein
MSSLSIPASVAVASLRLQLAPPGANPPSPPAGGSTTTAPASPFSPGNDNAAAAPPNANPASQAAQQITAGNAANSKAIQAGSNRIGSFLDINV